MSGVALRRPRSPVAERAAPVLRVMHRYTFSFALVLTLVLLGWNLIRTPDFGWTSQLANFAPLAIAAMASTPAIISGGGGFDLSTSPLMVFTTAAFTVWLVPNGYGGAEAVPILLALGAAVGAINGILIVRLRLLPVVVTLATFFILIGVNLRMVEAPLFVRHTWLTDLAHNVGPIPGPLFLIGFPLLAWILIDRIPYRRMLMAVGSNDAAAFSSGINVGVVRVAAYALGGMFAAVGGMAILAVTSTAAANVSQTYTLQAIAAVALGGTHLFGGRGGLFGSLLGAAAIFLMSNLLISFNLNASWLQVMFGVMLLVAVVFVGIGAKSVEAR